MLFWPLHFLSAETRCPLFHMANICVRGCGLSLFLGSPPLRQKTSARQLKPCIALCFCFSSQFFYSFCSQNKQSPFLYLGKSLRDIFISPPFFYHTYLHEYVVKSPGKKYPSTNPPPPPRLLIRFSELWTQPLLRRFGPHISPKTEELQA